MVPDKDKKTSKRSKKAMMSGRLTSTIHAFVVIVCLCLLFKQIWFCAERYLKRETSTKVTVLPVTHPDAPFICLSICPDYFSAYKSKVLANHGLPKDAFTSLNFIPASRPDMDIRRLFQEATYEFAEIVDSVILSTASITNGTVVIDIQEGANTSYFKVVTKPDSYFGRCYSLEFSQEATRLGISDIILVTFLSVYIYLGPAGQLLEIDTKTKVKSEVGHVTFVNVNYYNLVNENEDSKVLPCNHKMDHHFDSILYEAVNNQLELEFGCTLPFLPDLQSKQRPNASVPICSSDKDHLKKVYSTYLYGIKVGQNTLVEKPCTGMEITPGWAFLGKNSHPDKASIKIYLKSTVVTKHSVLDYNNTSMLADIGGYLGLLLGVSVVNISVLINKFVLGLLNPRKVKDYESTRFKK